jgi:hypothetical protein
MKLGISKPGQAHEHQQGEAAIHHQLDEPQRLRQPDQRRQPRGDRDQRPEELTENVPVEPGGHVVQTHGGFCGTQPDRCKPEPITLRRVSGARKGESSALGPATGPRPLVESRGLGRQERTDDNWWGPGRSPGPSSLPLAFPPASCLRPALLPLREVIAAHGLAARHSLGQHFLLDGNLTARSCAPPAIWMGAM